MNEDDFDTARRYPFIFPKAYVHSDDFSWIVMENTPPLIDMEEMQKVLDQSFPAEQKAILGNSKFMEKNRTINFADPFDVMGVIMDSFRRDREQPPGDFDVGGDGGVPGEIQDIIAPVAGAAYQELSKAMHEFEIDKYEIGIGNIGHDENYNFKIIDSSVFSSDPKDGGW